MKVKKLIAVILVIAMLFSFAACSNNNENDGISSPIENNSSVNGQIGNSTGKSTPVLYKATDGNGNTAYIFGSIHVGRESFYPLPDSVINAFDSADMLAVEFDIIAFENDISAQTDAVMAMLYSDFSKIGEHLSSEVYSQAVEILEKEKIYSSALDYYYPSLWSSFIDNIIYEKVNLDINSGIDRYFIERAYEKNKEVDDVESAEFQYSMMANYSDELQELLLELSIESYNLIQTEEGKKEYLGELAALMDAWQSGNPDEIDRIANQPGEFESAEEIKLYNEYQKAMITDRNIGMADYAEEALKSGKTVFICVGAAHVVGDGGIVDLLQKRGYTVEIVK